MSNKPTEPAKNSHQGQDDLGEFLLNRIAMKQEDLEVNKFFRALVKLEASDLHMKAGMPPMVRT